MKITFYTILLTLSFPLLGGASETVFQTITLQSALDDLLFQSDGVSELDTSFQFVLGTFANSFIPDSENTSLWNSNWRTFSMGQKGAFFPPLFTSEADILTDGSSSEDPGAYDFSGQSAWLWVYNSQDIQSAGTEWFLGRADNWDFPTIPPDHDPDCDDCPENFPLQLALSDLINTDVPVWGGQSGIIGSGFYDISSDDFTIQTYKVIPEPGTWMLVFIAFGGFGFSLLIRRKGDKS